MNVAVVYTGTIPALTTLVEEEIRKALGRETVIKSYQDPSILEEIRASGEVTRKAAARLITMFMKAVEEDADLILNACSSVGMAAEAAKEVGAFTGVPIVRIDTGMCREAVRRGRRIGVMATLATTLLPTKATLEQAAEEAGVEVTLIDGLIPGAFGLSPQEFKRALMEKAGALSKEADLLVLAQGSMAYLAAELEAFVRIPVLGSPEYGARDLRAAWEEKERAK